LGQFVTWSSDLGLGLIRKSASTLESLENSTDLGFLGVGLGGIG
jgi:hypothetical protein